MFIPRIIPVLLLKGKGLVKTVKFKAPRYIGDPINAVKIFNDLKADELLFLDITASIEGRCVSHELVKDIGDEAFMPFGVGGGISNIMQIEQLLKAGAEKVIISTQAVLNPNLILEASKLFGSQSIVVCMDIKKTILGKYELWIKNGYINSKKSPIELAIEFENHGAGEMIINSIDRDGSMIGYDIPIIKHISNSVSIPVIACGGAGSLEHLALGYYNGDASALAAGSMFVYHGPRNAVLINYPSKMEIKGEFYKCR